MKKIRLLLVVIVAMCWNANVFGQLNSTSSGLPNIGRGQIKFADFNNDGNQDALVVGQPTDYATTGTYTFKLYTGNGAGAFTDVTDSWFSTTPTAVAAGMVDIADYDRDGDLDFCNPVGLLQITQ